ncbi:MAG: NAD-dependent epimerase/dehydratase [Candidatus Roizmanbacteria bacterium GW2011_GWC2_37_13]|uniref:NAD-dependent epimerase/dehydratase n=1 Tax=Candidatus Roizmanbacteria bacterium GW2011_GWC2_37_13 TaxID=1618486 RepID=A0A0G0IM17_9BACT|nr:MAG: NAD-dependent epimerase/dehydratase [Candidatus Roizmanbacteria bacterium GW2011_GWC1_37_12]KKQ25249.1 MAG: NAD-dependent epimerase/dehydratase [Candidatus Roizmanbacteria bacterium GW2011_GWC2_37_13]
MKVLITGGAGFLGLHLAKYFSENVGTIHELSLLDIADFDKKEYPKNCRFIKVDIRNSQSVNLLIKKFKFDFVIHAAAALPLWKAKDIFEVNVNGTKNILESLLKNKVKRVIYISSTAVYGVPKKHPIYESDSRVGVGPYGQSKIEAENFCFDYIKKGLNVTILRPKTFLGTHRLGVFEILFDWIHDGKRIPLIGNGNNRYQLLDVDDLVEAVYQVLSLKGPSLNGAFNIGAEKYLTIKKDFEIFFRAIDSKSRIFPTPAFLVKKALWLFEKLKLSPLYQWVYDTADKDSFVSIEKLTKTLDWHPRYSNSDALIKAYRWYYKNYREIKSRGSGLSHTVGWKQGILSLIKKLM